MRVTTRRKDSTDIIRADGEELAFCDQEDAIVARLIWLVRESARAGEDLNIDIGACARLAVELQDPYDEQGESLWKRKSAE